MKKIRLLSSIPMIGTEEIAPMNEVADIFDHNKTQIINCFQSIESYINQLIVYDFLGRYDPLKKDQFEKFKARILHTSWFNFNEKRKMATQIVLENTSRDADKKEIESLLRKIMSYRNAFIHGKFMTNGIDSKMEYYEGELKEMNLTHKEWDKITETFSQGYSILRRLMLNLELMTVSKK
jgi:hypothetical protein